MTRMRLRWSDGSVQGVLYDTPTARQLEEHLPCSGEAIQWGKEVYFHLALAAETEPDARQVVEPGTICYWPDGKALAVGYGPTPISEGQECRLISPCNILGKVEDDPAALDSIQPGDTLYAEFVDKQ